MKQIVLEAPGRFAAGDTPEPVPGPDDAIVRVHRVGICGTDLHAFRGRQPFFEYPRVLGHELGVEVVEVGDAVTDVRAGDRCAVEPYLHCGVCIPCRRGRTNCCSRLEVLGVHTDGGMRPLLRVPAVKLHRSAALSLDQLALVETLGIGAHAVERADIQPDDRIVVVGAGPIGLSVIQFAIGTGRPLAVMDLSERRLAFCRARFGVAHTVTPGPGAPAALASLFDGDLPTLVFDATGSAASMAGAFELAASSGRIVFVGICQGAVAFDDPNFHRRELTLLASRNATAATFRQIIDMMETGRIDPAAWITHRLALDEVPERFGAIAGDPEVVKAMIAV